MEALFIISSRSHMKENLNVFKSLFNGRTDVFAIRRERDGKGDYFPAYDIDWSKYAEHKAKGGSFQNYPDKKLSPLTDQRIRNHLSGGETIGIYPLLENNTSWFIVADFDHRKSAQSNWMDDCRLFIAECEKHDLPVYLERSRSGEGGHVWLFFQQPMPAVQTRKLFSSLLERSGIISPFDRNTNFDRLFPNQDYHGGKSYGNLIALPMQGASLRQKNTCFIDPSNGMPFPDQWGFLNNIQKTSAERLETVLSSISPGVAGSILTTPDLSDNNEVQITLDNEIHISRQGLPGILMKFIHEHLRFLNSDYIVKTKLGKITYNTPAYFSCIKESDSHITFPKGIIRNLLLFCRENAIAYNLKDLRVKHEPVSFQSQITLHDYQLAAIAAADKKDMGIITAPPGTGKTMMALSIAVTKEQPTLIVVHRKQLFDQWIERIQSFLAIPKFRIGKIQGGSYEPGDQITVAMIQSLLSPGLPAGFYHHFGTVIVDECHHVPASTFGTVIQKFNSYYLYGFTATPFRKGGDKKLLNLYLGALIHEVTLPEADAPANKHLTIFVRDTSFSIPFEIKTDNIESLVSVLIHDTSRNELIASDVRMEVMAGRKVLVLTERKAHVTLLNRYLGKIAETITLSGDDSPDLRKSKFAQIEEGSYQVLIATGQIMGEGIDVQSLDCLVLAYPFSFEGKLIQYIGRVQRSDARPVIYDYRDSKIDYLDKLFRNRNKYYRKLERAGQLKPFDELVLLFEGDKFYIQSLENAFSIQELEMPLPVESFHAGVCWKVRVLKYDEHGELSCEIIDYSYTPQNEDIHFRNAFYFHGIERIRFRSIDTAAFLKAVKLKAVRFSDSKETQVTLGDEKPQEHLIAKTMKVPFAKINFLFGAVSFPLFIHELNQEILFRIDNPEIRPEFEAIRDYFVKIFKKKTISVDISLLYSSKVILSTSAKSEDIDSINSGLIETVRFEFVKRHFFKPKVESSGKPATLEEIATSVAPAAKHLFSSDQDLLDKILSIKEARHYYHLKYLSSRHEGGILKLRFVLQPFSFLFLLANENKYFVVWETLDTEEATYVWQSEKTRDALRNMLEEIEEIIAEIRKNGRFGYLKEDRLNFSRVLHDYSGQQKGFISWKGMLEERLL